MGKGTILNHCIISLSCNFKDGPMIPENPYEDRFERTFAFIDLSGFTNFTDVMGDKAALAE